ncbi:flagellar hook-basal body complex protein FliE [Massilia arenosa]|uniref:Flagellar hook-basal body complex protein FliE n=1 Tax=Zemynaea arenosa TaxID=2561931 RepID=A0A4Y9SY93_9BURK|nr:flagellar hook-basal body complex protein FliE [Massilia arenosa]TFW30184.1 flagellar hook-basal body complex protein FliE [Massilia arenosa]
MDVGGIDRSRILSMMEQMKAAAQQKPGGVGAPGAGGVGGVGAGPGGAGGVPKADFADALKNSLQAVSNSQNQADAMGQAFALGDDKVSLSDVMISMQKASINFQATVQVRNKLVAAYHDIMNMQV